MKFSNTWRLILGIGLAGIVFLLTGGVFSIEGQAQQYLTAASMLLAGLGIVPVKPAQIAALIPASVSALLTAAAGAGGFLLAGTDNVDPTLRGLLLAAIGFITTQLPPAHAALTATEPSTPPGLG